jgi:hypothetical protein
VCRVAVGMALRVLLTSLCLLVVAAPPTRAVVPPKDCGRIKANHHQHDIKADQMPCKTARRDSRRFIEDGRKPKGFSCQKYGHDTQLEFRCEKGIKVFFAIRR